MKNRKGESSPAVDTWVTRSSITPQRDGPQAGSLGQHSAASLRCRAVNLMRVGRRSKDHRPGDNGEKRGLDGMNPVFRKSRPDAEASPKAMADAHRRHAPRGRPVCPGHQPNDPKTASSGGGQANKPTRSSGPAPSPSEKWPVKKLTGIRSPIERSNLDNRMSASGSPASNHRTVRRMSAAKL
jgi:hypothetical protein